jgi:hypothetical protein
VYTQREVSSCDVTSGWYADTIAFTAARRAAEEAEGVVVGDGAETVFLVPMPVPVPVSVLVLGRRQKQALIGMPSGPLSIW